ncbi:hypothetical protein OESDEN_18095 [Oesophagostomum dentatum]|nr:hypothetical protein OESDEN_18095 [Oesophagostomum dentatum]
MNFQVLLLTFFAILFFSAVEVEGRRGHSHSHSHGHG